MNAAIAIKHKPFAVILKMRQIPIIFIIITLCSCEQIEEHTKSKPDHDSVDHVIKQDTIKTFEIREIEPTELTMLKWEQHEDSLRNLILQKKENKVLKESFLQEMYIRNVVSVSGDSLFIAIPFNVHGPDCGAPDGYSTEISFSFKFDDTIIFPENIQFQEHEYGSVAKERKLTGNFHLVEETEKHVIYYSTRHKRTLVLFSSNKENGTTAFYFTGVEQDRINGKNVYNIMKDYNEEDKNSIYPFTSWVLTTNEYENFME